MAATRRFFARALDAARRPTEVTTDRAPAYPRVLDELVPEAWHVVEQYANNPIEADHGRLKARTRPMRGLRRVRSAQVVCGGQAFVQNLRRGHDDLGFDTEPGASSKRASPNSLNSASIARGRSSSSPTQQRLTGPTGLFRQCTELSKLQRDLLARLDIPTPKKIIELAASS